MKVYLDGGWKQNGNQGEKKMVRLRDPTGQAMSYSAVDDSFADPESKSICYYIDLTASMKESGTTNNDNV